MSLAQPQRQLRVALADDHEGLRVLFRELLSLLPGVDIVGEAEDGVEAVELAESAKPDVFLLDVQMPRLDGIAAAELIRRIRPQTQLVVHSGSREEDVAERAREAGLRFLGKGQTAELL